MKDTELVIPGYSVSTAYKRLLGMQRNDQENEIYALFAYTKGDILQIVSGYDIGLGIEKYTFCGSRCYTDYYDLLKKLYDYENFLNTEVVDNATAMDKLQPVIKKFNAAYNPQTTNALKRIKCHIKTGKPCTFFKEPFAPYNPMVIKKDSKDLVTVSDCTPIFKSVARFAQGSSYIYIYELRLIDAVGSDSIDLYFIRPCVQISQFLDTGDADKYFKHSVDESKRFSEHMFYPKLLEYANPAIKRFEKYLGR